MNLTHCIALPIILVYLLLAAYLSYIVNTICDEEVSTNITSENATYVTVSYNVTPSVISTNITDGLLYGWPDEPGYVDLGITLTLLVVLSIGSFVLWHKQNSSTFVVGIGHLV